MYKKILSVILAGLMLVSFAGCSNKEADKSEFVFHVTKIAGNL